MLLHKVLDGGRVRLLFSCHGTAASARHQALLQTLSCLLLRSTQKMLPAGTRVALRDQH